MVNTKSNKLKMVIIIVMKAVCENSSNGVFSSYHASSASSEREREVVNYNTIVNLIPSNYSHTHFFQETHQIVSRGINLPHALEAVPVTSLTRLLPTSAQASGILPLLVGGWNLAYLILTTQDKVCHFHGDP